MIDAKQYFTNPTTKVEKPHSVQQAAAAEDVLERRNALRVEWALRAGKNAPIDPDTGTEISGKKNGTGGGGFRLEHEEGADNSSHKILIPSQGAAVDDYDPGDEFDHWLDTFEDGQGGNSKLAEYNLYREHPDDTPGWCHITTRAPHSGHRTFKP